MKKKQGILSKMFRQRNKVTNKEQKVEKKTSPHREVAIVVPPPLPVITEKDIVSYMDACGIGDQLEANEKRQFIEIATAFSLNPFKREIYCVPYSQGDKRKLSIITGYEVYLKRAERSGQLDGWDVTFTGGGKDLAAHITIWRKDRSHAINHSVDFSEYVQTTWKNGKQVPNKFWSEKPKTMLRKVAISQGFRLAFPDELGGMPYTADELPDEMTTPKNVTPPQKTKELPEAPKPTLKMETETPVEDDKGVSDAFDADPQTPPAPAEEICEGAKERVLKYVKEHDWTGREDAKEWVINNVEPYAGLTATQEATLMDRMKALNLKDLIEVY